MSLDLSNFDPAPSQGIGSGAPLKFDVTGSTETYALIVEIEGVRQLAWDGTEFAIPFAGQSSRTAISGGYRYTLRRSDGRWPLYPSIIARPLEGPAIAPDIAEALALLEPSDFEALGDLPTFDEDPTGSTAPVRTAGGALNATAHFATDGTRSATLTATGTAAGVAGDGSVPTVLQADGEVALVRVGDTRIALTGSGAIELQRWVTETGWTTRATLAATTGGFTASAAALRLVAGALAAVLSDSGGTMLCAVDAPLNIRSTGAMTVQPAQATAGAGVDLTVGGGPGQTPGTHAPGDVNVDLGTRVGNTGGRLNFLDGGSLLGSINAGPNFANYMTVSQERINSGLILDARSSGSNVSAIGSQGVSLQGVSATSVVQLQAAIFRLANASSVQFAEIRVGSATIASATTTNVATFPTTSNRVYQVFALITASNDTDNQGAAYWLRAAFKNVAGTVAQIGSTQAIAPDLEDAGQTGLAGVLDFSGTDLRARLTTDAADAVNTNALILVLERVLA